MVKTVQKSLNWRGRKVRAALAAVVCMAGLRLGFGGSSLLAQLGGGNPVPNEEVAKSQEYCEYDVTGLTNADFTFLQNLGWGVGLNVQPSNAAHDCPPCAGGMVTCPAPPVHPPGLVPDPLLFEGSVNLTAEAANQAAF